MKKLNVLICVLLMLFCLIACGNTTEESESVTTTVPTTALTTVHISATKPENSLASTTEATTTEPTTVVTTSVTTAESITVYTTTNSTAEKVTKTKPTTTESVTTKKQTITEATTTKPVTTEKQTTTKPITTKPVITAKPTTTKPTTEATTQTQTTSAKKYCTVRIECKTIYDNIGKLKGGKKAFLPTNGIILDNVQVEFSGSESAFDVIKKACEENVCTDNCQYCKANGVQIEYTYTPAFNNYYIEGIHQIYEKDCGTQSGWMYSVNGAFPDVGTSSYTVSPGDVIVFAFTCNMGEDIGNSY